MTTPPLRRPVTALAAAGALAYAALTPAQAFPTDPAAGNRPITGSAAATATALSTTVTLVTGDRVSVSIDAAGGTSVSPMPADGRRGQYLSRQVDDDRYVFPLDAVPAVQAGALDEELFNVTGLVRQGYDDQHTKTLPLIGTYSGGAVTARVAPAVPAGARRTHVLDSIDSVALEADKATASTFWQSVDAQLTGPATRAAGGRLTKLWLDRRVTATLDRSTAQVGAPTAWAAGFDGTGTTVAVLDTGVDAEHPDLVGKVTASADFTLEGSTADGHGHGTHTASTVAGTGAASGGAKKGVAPGANLLIGKVLDSSGSGYTSWIVEGMEWAVAQHADVVSMSLGGQAGADCLDPLAEAAARLGKDTLFVVAAGNDGPKSGTVSTPACVPDVLTVGAVDRDDTTADFSSRGFAHGTHVLKPEIAAPGVAISAARAGGRGADAYRTMSGTSMATPHVAGAAAILHQQHPEWTAAQLKAALISAATPKVPGGVTEVGAGRLDVGAAVTATVGGPGVVQAGPYTWPQQGRQSTDVTYTNRSQEPVTLRLALAAARANDGGAPPSGLLSLGAESLTVPAGGTASVPLVADFGVEIPYAQYGEFGGRVVATAPSGGTISTPFSLYVEPKSVDLTLRVLDRTGSAPALANLMVTNVDAGESQTGFLVGTDTLTMRVRAGSNSLSALVSTYDAGTTYRNGLVDSETYLGYPQLELTEDTTLVLDSRAAHRVSVTGERPLEDQGSYLGYGRWGGEWLTSGGFLDDGTLNARYVLTSGRAEEGGYEVDTMWRMGAPELSLRVDGRDGFAVPALYSSGVFAVDPLSRFDGRGSAALVDAGTGTPDELAAAGVRGKVVLVRADATWMAEQIANDAKAAGAVAVLLHRADPGRWQSGASNALPIASIDAATTARLQARLAAATLSRPVTLRWAASSYSPYMYNLVFPETRPISRELRYRVDDDELARVDGVFGAVGTTPQTVDWLNYARPWNPADFQSIGVVNRLPLPGTRTEFYTPGKGQWRHSVSSAPLGGYVMNTMNTYRRSGRYGEESWFRGVLHPVAGRSVDDGSTNLVGERQGDLVGFDFRGGYLGDDTAGHWGPGNFFSPGSLELRRGDEVLGTSPMIAGVFEVPTQAGEYSLRLTTDPADGTDNPKWRRSTSTDTVFRFRSQADGAVFSQPLGLLFPSYAAPVDARNTVAARGRQEIGLSVSGQAGFTPGGITAASLAYSYDGGATWTAARTSHRHGKWTATVDHAGASGKSVTLKVELTDASGSAVTQTVVNAYPVR